MAATRRSVWVVVLGDFGRSPRMQYHTLSLAAQERLQVHVLGYADSRPLQSIQGNPDVTLHALPATPALLQKLPRILGLPLKALFQALVLLWMMLCVLPAPDLLLLQVPPAIPTLPLCWLVCRLRGALFAVDWHNYAYTLMALSMGSRSPLVRLAERVERFWGRQADVHFCVTAAMQRDLATRWGIAATVFHDKPPPHFRPATLAEQHDVWLRLSPSWAPPLHPQDFCSALLQDLGPRQAGSQRQHQQATLRTQCPLGGGAPVLRAARPALVVSSTSWTPDEDFGVLLAAAQLYDKQAQAEPSRYPQLLIAVTGKGPQREAFLAQLKATDLRRVAFRLAWLEAGDYPLLLGAADLGVSLHTSSSGLDLPMKVVDMFGCGLPVCAISYACIGELVTEEHGCLFATPEQLAGHLLRLLEGFPDSREGRELQRLRAHNEAQAEDAGERWQACWERDVAPSLLGRRREGEGSKQA